MPVVFDRYKPHSDRTIALRKFNRSETEINQHFWSFKVVSDYTGYLARAEKEKSPDSQTAELFKATGANASRIPVDVSEWLEARAELENWLRLSALVSATSYLEAYLRQVVRTALLADPGCHFQSPSLLDGAALMKKEIELPFDKDIELVTKGDWSQRLAAFGKTFGNAPRYAQQNTKQLDRMRNLRNDVAHGFGREITAASPLEMDLKSTARLSQPTFLKYLGIISKVAADIDKQLLKTNIRGFEPVYFYHSWRKTTLHGKEKNFSKERALSRALNTEKVWAVNTQFAKDLIEYYNSL